METFVFLAACAIGYLYRNLTETTPPRGRRPHNLFRSRYEQHSSESESGNSEFAEFARRFTSSVAENTPETVSPSPTVPRTVYYTVEDANKTIEKMKSDKRNTQEDEFARRVEESVSKNKSDSPANSELCVVCIEKVPFIRFSCCTHMLCEECMVNIWEFSDHIQQDNKIIVKCPYCRQEGFVRKTNRN